MQLSRVEQLWFAEMTQGERVMLMLQPEYSYAQKGCQFKPPKGYPPDADFVFDIQLAAIHPAQQTKVTCRVCRSQDLYSS